MHVAARIMASAGEGEILVSSVVKDLSLGSSLVFAPRGSHSLKGVPGEWSLFAASIAANEDMQHGRRIAGLRIVDPFRDD